MEHLHKADRCWLGRGDCQRFLTYMWLWIQGLSLEFKLHPKGISWFFESNAFTFAMEERRWVMPGWSLVGREPCSGLC